MVLIKFLLMNLLICSDFILFSGFLKYCQMPCSSKNAEIAKQHIIIGAVLNVIASNLLLIIHLMGGVGWESYTTFEWLSLVCSLVAGIFFASSLAGIWYNNRFFIETHRYEKIDGALLIISAVTMVVSTLSFQLFLMFVSF